MRKGAMRFIRLATICSMLMPICGVAGELEPFFGIEADAKNPQLSAKIELGRKLFFDRRLSGDGTMSCSTCHDPNQGFSDGLAISLSYPTTRNWRNSPTLYNVGLQKLLFHDGRVATLEEQALFPMMSAFEMNQNLDFLEEEIRAVPEYVADFKTVFGDDDTSRERIAMAIAAFERTIVSGNAPLDRFLTGEKNALSPEAQKGYELFIGKGNCIECHNGVNLSDGGFHVLQVPENVEQERDPRVAATRRFVAKLNHYEDFRNLEEDPGRYLITKNKADWKAFKTPTLREIAATGPYMHNGTFATLAEVIEFINAGGGNDTSELEPLQLTADEKEQLRLFLEEGLTGVQQKFIYPKIY
ncbi:cytochrome-c peroxidase [Desulfopila aestuarii]|uniref:Methylamine utilization protein MauG n=1 Tax=Desulfopila aestuarii DSM 18488 TaxID=1121416 RepID=A0A1M7Y5Y5_9BACT|nr:cytochrome c peroxidase [Desulfopila aestuarii]SHO47977.1 cytochrome c peroxidase [Desulfopila aestuarii DSM 18488]